MKSLPIPVLSGVQLVRMDLTPPCSRWGGHHQHLVLQADGPAEALEAVTRFFHGGWLQDSESPDFLQRVLALLPGWGVNLREEGQVIRYGDRLHLWSDMTYFERTAEADLHFHEVCDVVRLNLRFLALRREWVDSPTRRGLPSYDAERGFRVRALLPG